MLRDWIFTGSRLCEFWKRDVLGINIGSFVEMHGDYRRFKLAINGVAPFNSATKGFFTKWYIWAVFWRWHVWILSKKENRLLLNYFVGPLGRVDDTVSMAPSVQGLQITTDISVDLQGQWTQYYMMVMEVIWSQQNVQQNVFAYCGTYRGEDTPSASVLLLWTPAWILRHRSRRITNGL